MKYVDWNYPGGINVLVNRCSCCGKELTILQYKFSLDHNGECSECAFLHNLGFYTIDQLNEWLRK